MKYSFIKDAARSLPVDGLCDYLNVSRSGYYAWLARRPGKRAEEDVELGELVAAEFRRSRKTYGSRRIRDQLRRLGRAHSRRRISRMMSSKQLVARKTRRFVATTVADPARRAAPNVLNREFQADGPNRKWASDITLIPTGEGYLYLATTMDLWSRRIVGWSIQEKMGEGLVEQAFNMAVEQRWPNPGLLHHSDRGSQYTARSFRAELRRRRMVESNSRKGDVWDNAAMESFYSTLEMELLRQNHFVTRAEAIQEVFSYIEVFYNRQRIHSALGGRSPAEFEAAG